MNTKTIILLEVGFNEHSDNNKLLKIGKSKKNRHFGFCLICLLSFSSSSLFNYQFNRKDRLLYPELEIISRETFVLSNEL